MFCNLALFGAEGMRRTPRTERRPDQFGIALDNRPGNDKTGQVDMKTFLQAAVAAVAILAITSHSQAEAGQTRNSDGLLSGFANWLATPPERSRKSQTARRKAQPARRQARRTRNKRNRAGSRYDYRSYRDNRGNIDWNAYARTRVTTSEALSTGTTGRVIRYNGSQEAGSIVISTAQRALFLVMPGGKARMYKVGVGRPGFEWFGTHKISRKTEWPDWRPPEEMRQRQPYLPEFMPGGPGNPMGARALYLGSTLYRIHGTTEDHTIGSAVSSGCIRMLNQDVIDLYKRVGVGTKVYVKS